LLHCRIARFGRSEPAGHGSHTVFVAVPSGQVGWFGPYPLSAHAVEALSPAHRLQARTAFVQLW
jgi:hypothetical protein